MSKSAEEIARELQAQIAAQLASVSSMLQPQGGAAPSWLPPGVPGVPVTSTSTSTTATSTVTSTAPKKAAYRPLLLDSQGREIDEKGMVVQREQQVRTLAANAASAREQQKKENPYLAHRQTATKRDAAASLVAGTATPAIAAAEPAKQLVVVDERLKVRNRDARAKFALHFVEPGSIVEQAEAARHKEERKVIAGYASGRKAPEAIDANESSASFLEAAGIAAAAAGSSAFIPGASPYGPTGSALVAVAPPTVDGGVVPVMEWWDEAFLPKEVREARKKSVAAQLNDDYEIAALTNCKTFKLIQHPVPVKPLGGEKSEESLPMYLTKKERKRIRRQAREQREREKRDKMMMGLIPVPETKFKLSNFMKILGDQAVADPSKIELKVIKEMRKRQLNHEMRNLARKLTPAERKEKKRKKLTEDTSRQVYVAVFRVKDFSSGKFRFKVDVNAQQLNLSGVVLSCPSVATNMIVFEGGVKGIRKIIKLMLRRIPWDAPVDGPGGAGGDGGGHFDDDEGDASDDESDDDEEVGGDAQQHQEEEGATLSGARRGRENDEVGDGGDAKRRRLDDGSQATAAGLSEGTLHAPQNHYQPSSVPGNPVASSTTTNRCDLLWQGIVAKRTFTGFRFQECRTSSAARKVMEARGVQHYWDMAARADTTLAITQSTDIAL